MDHNSQVLRPLAVGFVAVCLAGCGGSATSVAGLNQLQQDFTDLSNKVDAASVTNPANFPTGVSNAEYAGVFVALETEETTPVNDSTVPSFLAIGDVDITIDFTGAAPSLTGTASNFYEITDFTADVGDSTAGTAIAGSFTIDTNINIDGSLTKVSGEVADFDLSGGAVLFGDTAELISGTATGTSVDTNGGRADLNAGAVFVAERD